MALFDGSGANDQYFGTPQADLIRGNGGQDQLRGAAGNDTIHGGEGPDSLYGDQGHDTIYGNAGDDVVRGGRGEDTLHGGNGIDMLAGDRDNDFLFGDAGDDILLGGPGDDTIQGGPGADFINGGEGDFDLVSYRDSPDGVQVSLDHARLVVGRGGTAEGDILVGVEMVVGSNRDDDLDAAENGSVDGLFGEDGDDTLSGGGLEPDLLDGGNGDDHLLAFEEGGIMNGGAGNDLFEFYGSKFRGGEIEDFTTGEDKIGFDFSVEDITTSDLNNMLRGSTGNVLDLSLLGQGFADFGALTLNVPVSTLSASDFIIE